MTMPLPTPDFDFLTCSFRPDVGVLTVRWLRAVSFAELTAGFEAARQLGVAHGATRWLVDVRRRTELDSTSSGWVAQELLPAAAASVAPDQLVVAYLLSPARNELLHQDPALRTIVASVQAPTQPYLLRTFLEEGQAMQWLLAQ